MSDPQGVRRAGRPVDTALREEVVRTMGALLGVSGYDEVTIEAVAARAGTTKQTVYRVWGSKAELAADAIASGAFALTSAPVPETDDLEDDLVAWMQSVEALLRRPGMRSLVQALASVSQSARGLRRSAALDAALSGPVRAQLAGRLAAEHGLRGDDERVTAASALIVGYLTLASISEAGIDEPRSRAIVSVLLGGLTAGPGVSRT